MNGIRRVMGMLDVPLILIVPAWLTIGRALLGSIGWFTVMLVWFVLPVLFVVQLVAAILRYQRPAGEARDMQPFEAITTLVFAVAAFLAGLVMPDFGDVASDQGSVIARNLGEAAGAAADVLFVPLAVVVMVSLAARVVASWRAFRAR